MSKKFLVITDLHQGMLHAKDYSLDKIENFKGMKISLSDNFDSKNCLKKDLEKLKTHWKDLDAVVDVNLQSNHEGTTFCESLDEFYFDTETNSMWCHGHQLKSNYEKYKKDCYTNWKGTNYFVWLVKGLANKLIHIVPFGKDDAARAVSLAKKYGCTTIVCGHYHTSYDQVVDGVRVISVPRGLTTITVGY